jgi:hypothetical protein
MPVGAARVSITAAALTLPSARDPFFSNDGLEFLGDAVLKLLACVYVYLRDGCGPLDWWLQGGCKVVARWLQAYRLAARRPCFTGLLCVKCRGRSLPGHHEGVLTWKSQALLANEVCESSLVHSDGFASAGPRACEHHEGPPSTASAKLHPAALPRCSSAFFLSFFLFLSFFQVLFSRAQAAPLELRTALRGIAFEPSVARQQARLASGKCPAAPPTALRAEGQDPLTPVADAGGARVLMVGQLGCRASVRSAAQRAAAQQDTAVATAAMARVCCGNADGMRIGAQGVRGKRLADGVEALIGAHVALCLAGRSPGSRPLAWAARRDVGGAREELLAAVPHHPRCTHELQV